MLGRMSATDHRATEPSGSGSATVHTEVELKFDIDATTAVPDFSDAGLAVVRTAVHELSAVYWDTEDLALIRHKITLRRRTGGTDAGWHMKFPGSHGRREFQIPHLAPEVPREIVDEASAALGRAIYAEDLRPIAQIDNTRHVAVLARQGDSEAVELYEVCDDHVTTTSLLPGGMKQTWREWEIELTDAALGLADGGENLTRSVSAIALAAGAKPSRSKSKLVTAIGENAIPPREDVSVQ